MIVIQFAAPGLFGFAGSGAGSFQGCPFLGMHFRQGSSFARWTAGAAVPTGARALARIAKLSAKNHKAGLVCPAFLLWNWFVRSCFDRRTRMFKSLKLVSAP